MVLPKSKTTVGLGNTLMNDRFGKGKGSDRKKASAVVRTNHATGEEYLVNERQDAAWVKMRSITEQSALDEFLATAELAGTDFTAEKMNNVKIIQMDQTNPFLLSAADERTVLRKHKEHADKLTIPKRPKWNESTTPEQLRKAEMEGFYEWRKLLRDLAENNDLVLTPFERNLEVWRQLWRVVERSDIVVQIVDARNPLLYMSRDLQRYVKDVDAKKTNLLLINKADMLTLAQRRAWADYLKEAGLDFRYFSASLAQQMNEELEDETDYENAILEEQRTLFEKMEREAEEGSGAETESDDDEEQPSDDAQNEDDDQKEQESISSEDEEDDDDTRILTVDELEEMLLRFAPKAQDPEHKFTVGLVGYPNVGKSSTINALVGAKKVSVSATPGKTKHFQTIHLSDQILLCDCPGLVFPYFATTKADLVTNGVLPIDECREYIGPVGLVAERIPKPWIEVMYGIEVNTKPLEEGGTGMVTAHELLESYARSKGMMSKLGRANESMAARYILKDYVNGKLLWCHPPPTVEDSTAFNLEHYDIHLLPDSKKRSNLLAKEVEAAAAADDDLASLSTDLAAFPTGAKSARVDKGFFGPGSGNAGHVTQPFNYKYSEQGRASGKSLSGRKARTMVALDNGLDPKDVKIVSGKKHFKGGARKGKGKKVANPYDEQ